MYVLKEYNVISRKVTPTQKQLFPGDFHFDLKTTTCRYTSIIFDEKNTYDCLRLVVIKKVGTEEGLDCNERKQSG